MKQLLSVLKWLFALVAFAILCVIAYLLVAPPELLRVGTNYAAKTVCSNVFIADRDADEVLRVDVQAPGHPLLGYVSVNVDPEEKRVSAHMFGIFAKATAVYREGLGCAALPSNKQADLADISLQRPNFENFDVNAIWPEGNKVIQNQDGELQNLLDSDALAGPNMRAMVVVHNGRIVGERYGEGFSADTPLLGWSMTKTITGALVGTLLNDAFQLSTRTLMPEWENDERANISLRMLLGMESGLEWNEGYGDVSDVTRMLYLTEDAAEFVASLPLLNTLEDATFHYSSGTSALVSRIWQDQIGANSLLWPDRALFEPLAMRSAVLEPDAAGTFLGSSYLYASARDWARFGLMLAQGGRWAGKQILPEDYFDFMVTPSEKSLGPWGKYEYGGHIWLQGPRGPTPERLDPDAGYELPQDMIWMVGHDGQTIAISPSNQLVVVRMGLTPSRWGYKPQPLVSSIYTLLKDKELN